MVFTSEKDDSAGGDSNDDGSATAPRPDDWGQILFTGAGSGGVLDQVAARYGGIYVNAEVEADASSPTISNSVVEDSGSYGVRLLGSKATLSGDTFQGDGFENDGHGGAIEMDLNSQPVITGTTFSENYVNAAVVDGGSLPAGVTTWDNPGVAYWLDGSVTVPSAATLNVDAGQVVKLDAGLVVQGTLDARGTAAQPVVFTSEKDDSAGGDSNDDGSATAPRPDDWGQILFTGAGSGGVLDQVAARYGGIYVNAEVEADGTSPTISDSTLSDAGGYGLGLVGSDAVVTGDTFQRDGFESDGHGGAIHMDTASAPTVTGAQISGDFVNGAVIDGGTLPAGTTTWNQDVVYWTDGNITIPQNAKLVLNPGQTVKVGSYLQFIVQGTLQAAGTAFSPIVFTSKYDDSSGGDTNDDGSTSTPHANDWSGIQFTSTSTADVMDHAEVRYGGQVGTENLSAIEVDGAALSLTNSVVRDGVHAGLVALSGSNVTLTGDLFVQNAGGTALQFEAGSTGTVVNNTLDGNLFGMVLDGGTVKFANNLVTNNSNTGIYERDPSTLTMTDNDVYNPGNLNGNYVGLTDPTGTSGNLSADPRYFNEPSGQYELHPGSPAEDAGTGAARANHGLPGQSALPGSQHHRPRRRLGSGHRRHLGSADRDLQRRPRHHRRQRPGDWIGRPIGHGQLDRPGRRQRSGDGLVA